jgi:hypothetical protein
LTAEEAALTGFLSRRLGEVIAESRQGRSKSA